MNPARPHAPFLWPVLERVALAAPSRIAIHFKDRSISYGQLHESAMRLAMRLWRQGVRPGDRVGLLAANRPEYLELLFATSRIGAILAPFNSRYGTSDLRHVLSRSAVKILFVSSRFRTRDFEALVNETLAQAASDAGGGGLDTLANVVAMDEGIEAWRASLEAMPAEGFPDGFPSYPQVAGQGGLVLFTSGSTGAPKPVLLSEARMVLAMTRTQERQAITQQDLVLSFLPYFHVFGGLISTLAPLLAGGTIVMMEAYDALESLEAVQRHRCTVVYGVGPCFQDWLDHPSFGRYDVSSIRTGVCSAGSAASSAMAKRVREAICPMHSHFSMTETCGVGTMTRIGDPIELATETAGCPMPGVRIEIREPGTGAVLGADTEGEICISSDMLALGYLNQPGVSTTPLVADGWLHSGDRGWLGKDGYLRIIGRLDDRLRCGGENIDPQEVERFLSGHESVTRAYVVGVPEPRLGEIPVAFVILDPTRAAVTQADLQAFCKGRIADFKIPRRIFFVDEVPGWLQKIQRHSLRQDAIRRMALT